MLDIMAFLHLQIVDYIITFMIILTSLRISPSSFQFALPNLPNHQPPHPVHILLLKLPRPGRIVVPLVTDTTSTMFERLADEDAAIVRVGLLRRVLLTVTVSYGLSMYEELEHIHLRHNFPNRSSLAASSFCLGVRLAGTPSCADRVGKHLISSVPPAGNHILPTL